MSTENVDLLDVINYALLDDHASSFHAMPGRVKSYDATKQTVVVEPTVKLVTRNADGDRIVDVIPVLSDIPVQWMRGGGYFMTMPLSPGDGGLILVTDTDIGAWRSSGQVSDPGDERRHALGGAVFVPGLETVARALTGAGAGHLVVGKEGGPAVHIDASTVQLGAAGGNFVALANLVQAAISTLKGATSIALSGVPVAGAGLQTAFDTATASVPGSVAATLVKAT